MRDSTLQICEEADSESNVAQTLTSQTDKIEIKMDEADKTLL